MRSKNNGNMSLIGVLLLIIVGLFYYLYNKRRIDYQVNTAIGEESKEAVKDYYVSGWEDLKAVFRGEKKFFGN